MLASRAFRSSTSLARQKIAMTSDATVMSNPSSRGKPLAAPPSDETIERIAPVDVVVDHGSEQVVRRRDRVEVTGEVEVDVLHRNDLSIAAAGRAALHTERRPEARLAQAQHGLLADVIERVSETDGG